MHSPNHDFSTGSVSSRILQQAIPLTLAQIVQLLYNIVDRIFIGHLPEVGDMAITGLGITFPVIVIIAAFTALFGQGGIPLFSIVRGQGDEEQAEKIIGNVFALLTLSSIVLFLFCYFLRRPILFLFGASDDSFVYADKYLQIYLLGTLFSMLTTGMNGFINAQGFPKIGMATTIIGAVINIILDPLFIFVFDMGVRGAALATVISQGISAVWVMRFLTGPRAVLRLKRAHIHISADRTIRIAKLGLPGFVMQGTNSLVQIVCNTQLQMLGGDLYVGVMTIIGSVREILSLPVGGISSGAQPVLGFNYGAGKYRRVKEGIRFMSFLGIAYTAIAWIVVMIIPEALLSLFGCDAEAISTGAEMMNIYFFGFVFMSLQFVGQSTFQGLGKAKNAIIFSLLRKAFIVVPLTFILPHWFGVCGVFLAEPISNAIGGLACFMTMWFGLYRKLPDDSQGIPR
ncbi:MAG: MATE family efflux transporter [Clostridia bacterium]|nr:MATE family efflux transporter [Clostridia bacterium]